MLTVAEATDADCGERDADPIEERDRGAKDGCSEGDDTHTAYDVEHCVCGYAHSVENHEAHSVVQSVCRAVGDKQKANRRFTCHERDDQCASIQCYSYW